MGLERGLREKIPEIVDVVQVDPLSYLEAMSVDFDLKLYSGSW